LTGAGAGYFVLQGYVEVPGVSPGAPASVQVRAWDAGLGSSYEQVVALGIGGYGESILLHINSGGTLQSLPAPLLGLQSFSLLAEVPEPNAVVLLLFGLPLLLLRKRRCK
jgi:hypothetical protein